MVDWETVEKRRTQGWDWDRIAADPKVDFHADPSMGEPGRALRALYIRQKSRRSGTKPKSGKGGIEPPDSERRWTLVRIGYLVAPLLVVWFLLAYLFPTPVGLFVSWFPYLVGAALVGVAILAVGLFRTSRRWSKIYRNTVAGGVVLGIIVASGMGIAAIIAGCPTLSSSTIAEPQSWSKAANSPWQSGGAPVFLFYGSIACPYCSASSWATLAAMLALGSVSTGALAFGYSSPSDVYPNTPEVYVTSIQVSSSHVSLDAREGMDPTTITTPTVSCVEQAYVTQYNYQASIPFIVINGQYFHIGTVVNPADLAGLTYSQVYGQVTSQSGSAWTAISGAAYLQEAILVKVNNGQPTSVADNPNVKALLSQLS
jgi:glutaredoxin